MTDKLSAIPPLGKSAEEIEAEDANRVNPAVPGEHADAHSLAPLPIANAGSQGIPGNFTSGSAPIIGPLGVIGAQLQDDVNTGRTNDDATDNSQS